MLMKHLSERPRPLAQVRDDLPANLVHAIDRALAKGRDERWKDAEAFRVALAEDAPGAPAPRRSGSGSIGVVPPPAPEPLDPIERLHLDTPLPAPPFPPLPRDWMFHPTTREHGKEVLRQWREAQRQWREARGRPPMVRQELREAAIALGQHELQHQRSAAERVTRVRRKMAGGLVTIGMLAVINALTSPGFPWVLFPAIGIGFGVVKGMAGLWADGIPVRDVFRRPPRPAVSGSEQPLRRLEAKLPAPAASSVAAAVMESVPRDVLEGPHGRAIREAFDARAQIRSVLTRLPETERTLLPEILPTVESLVERVRTLAVALHALDAEASPEALERLRRRVVEAEAVPEDAPERERRLELLRRQLATLTDLAERRTTLGQQLEHAGLVLGTMKLDLMRLRNSGVESRLADQGQVTQEMRELAREVQRVAEAVEETKRQT
jgi:hypothetical protein